MLLSVTIPRDVRIIRPREDNTCAIAIKKTQALRVMNLISDRAHSRTGRRLLRIGLTTVTEVDDSYIQSENLPSGSYYRLSVTDTSLSIEKPTPGNVFEPTSIVKKNSRMVRNDLLVEKRIVKKFHALVIVERTDGAGITSHVYLPTDVISDLSEKKETREVLLERTKAHSVC